jgi:hypothetical protein
LDNHPVGLAVASLFAGRDLLVKLGTGGSMLRSSRCDMLYGVNEHISCSSVSWREQAWLIKACLFPTKGVLSKMSVNFIMTAPLYFLAALLK